MKIAIAAAGRDLDAPVDPRFGRCQAFLIVDTEDMSFSVIENTAARQGSGAGIAAAQLVANSGAEAVIASHAGPNAFQALTAGGLKIYACEGGTVREAIEAFKAGKLPEISGANVPPHYGTGGGDLGRGGGAGLSGGPASMADSFGPGAGYGRGCGRGGVGPGCGGFGRGAGGPAPATPMPGNVAGAASPAQRDVKDLAEHIAALERELQALKEQIARLAGSDASPKQE